MNARQTGLLVAVALAALIVGSWLGPRTQAQKAEQPPPAGLGREQDRVQGPGAHGRKVSGQLASARRAADGQASGR